MNISVGNCTKIENKPNEKKIKMNKIQSKVVIKCFVFKLKNNKTKMPINNKSRNWKSSKKKQ
jgi:hypothetical protein